MNSKLVFAYAVAAFIVACVLQYNLLLRFAHTSDEKVGLPLVSSRTDASDNYAYFSLVKGGANACNRSAESATADLGGNGLACSYMGGLLAEHVLLKALTHFQNPRLAVALLLIANTMAYAFAFLIALTVLTDLRLSFAAAIVAAGTNLYVIDNFGLSLYTFWPDLNFKSVLGIEPSFARLMNPTAFWAIGLLLLAAVAKTLQGPRLIPIVLALLGAALCSISGLAVTITLALGLSLFIVISYYHDKSYEWPTAIVVLVLSAGLAWTLFQLKLYGETELGRQLSHGQVQGFRLRPHFLLVALVGILGWVHPTDSKRNRMMACLVVGSAGIGVVCESAYLGDRLWLRGSVVFVLLFVMAWFTVLLSQSVIARRFASKVRIYLPSHSAKLEQPLAVFASVLVLLGAIVWARPAHLDTWSGFVDRDKYDVLNWLVNTEPGTIVASTNIEDNFLINFYTSNNLFAPLYGLSPRSWPETLRRYFYVINQVKEGDETFSRLASVTPTALQNYNNYVYSKKPERFDYAKYQSMAFLGLYVYYPYNADSKGLFAASGEMSAKFLSWFSTLRDEARSAPYKYTYLVTLVTEQLVDPSRYQEMYRNNGYVIWRLRNLSEVGEK